MALPYSFTDGPGNTASGEQVTANDQYVLDQVTALDTRVTTLEAPAEIHGIVSGAGAVVRGSGFTATKNATGDYTVTFTSAYAAAPAITVTPQGSPSETRLSASSGSSFRVTFFSSAGSALDPDVFHFHVFGF